MMHSRISILATAVMLVLSLLATTEPAVAAVEYNLWIPFTDDFDSCAGERVEVSGTQHLVGTTTEDGTGQLHFTFTRHTQGTGVGTMSGTDYLLIDSVAKVDLIGAVDGEQLVFTQKTQALFIRKGESAPRDDSIVHIFTHITMTPNGDIKASVEITSAACR
jgi:hypothetical protein